MTTSKKQPLNFRNITISGLPGAGSSTLGKALAEVLDWEYFSGGDFMRAYAIERGLFDANNKAHHDATVYSQDFDRQVDYGMRETLEKKSGKILESWLSSFMAQGILGSLKILVFCSADDIRVDRIINRDDLTVTQAKKHIFEREIKNNSKWVKVYKNEWKKWVVDKGIVAKSKPIWFWYPEMYDLKIDTYKSSKEQTLEIVLNRLGYKGKVNYKKVF